jgi:hypothetical protein
MLTCNSLFEAEVPFAIISQSNRTEKNSLQSNLWISYEDARSARKKAEYAKKMSLGGVSIWSLDMDDFKGWFCNLGSYPIIESIKEELESKMTLIEDELEKIPVDTQKNSDKKSDKNKEKNNDVTSTIENELSPNKMSTHELIMKTKNPPKGSGIKEIKLTKNPKGTTNNMKTTTEVQAKDVSTLDSLSNKYKKFKAIREIKLIACLDTHKCHIKQPNNMSELRPSFLSINLSLFIIGILTCLLFP